MAANPRSLALEQVHADRLADLQRDAVRLVADRYDRVDPDFLGRSFRQFIPAASEIIAMTQDRAVTQTHGFMRTLVRLETGNIWEPSRRDVGIPGTTIDGRDLQSALASVPPAVLIAIQQGRPIPEALKRGRQVAIRMAATETADAARRETDNQLIDHPQTFTGWQWVARGTCAACLAMMNNKDRPPGPLEGHPGCTCIKSPSLAGVEGRYPRLDGRQLWDLLTPAQQKAIFKFDGDAKAEALRKGVIDLDDLVKRERGHEWRDLLTEGKLYAKKLPTLEDDLAQLDELTAIHKAKVAEVLGGKNAATIERATAKVMDDAAAAEPRITSIMQDTQRASGGELEGLANRLKAEDSLQRKIGGDMLADPKLAPAKAAEDINDALRYTLTFDDDNYWPGVQKVLDDLAEQGIKPLIKSDGTQAWKDFWDGDIYRGINAVFVDSKGTKFELQLHTKASYAMKQKQHKVYEAWRISTNEAQNERLYDAMVPNWGDDIVRPAGPTPVLYRTPSPTAPWLEQLPARGPDLPEIDSELLYRAGNTRNGAWLPSRAALHDDIIDDVTRGVTKSDKPTVYMMGGGPATGKTTVIDSGAVKVPKTNRVLIDPDDMKARLPEYQPLVKRGDEWAASYVHEESSYLSKVALSKATKAGNDIHFDGTGDNTIESLAKKVADMRADGHRVVANYVSLPTDLAVENAAGRALKTGRKVPENYIRSVHVNVSKVFPEALKRGLFDEATLYDTSIKGAPRLVLTYKNGVTKVHDQKLWDDFLKKADEPTVANKPGIDDAIERVKKIKPDDDEAPTVSYMLNPRGVNSYTGIPETGKPNSVAFFDGTKNLNVNGGRAPQGTYLYVAYDADGKVGAVLELARPAKLRLEGKYMNPVRDPVTHETIFERHPNRIARMAVDPGARGQGLMKRLYDHVQDHTEFNLYEITGTHMTSNGKGFVGNWLAKRAAAGVDDIPPATVKAATQADDLAKAVPEARIAAFKNRNDPDLQTAHSKAMTTQRQADYALRDQMKADGVTRLPKPDDPLAAIVYERMERIEKVMAQRGLTTQWSGHVSVVPKHGTEATVTRAGNLYVSDEVRLGFDTANRRYVYGKWDTMSEEDSLMLLAHESMHSHSPGFTTPAPGSISTGTKAMEEGVAEGAAAALQRDLRRELGLPEPRFPPSPAYEEEVGLLDDLRKALGAEDEFWFDLHQSDDRFGYLDKQIELLPPVKQRAAEEAKAAWEAKYKWG